jgi:hypothetical protein
MPAQALLSKPEEGLATSSSAAGHGLHEVPARGLALECSRAPDSLLRASHFSEHAHDRGVARSRARARERWEIEPASPRWQGKEEGGLDWQGGGAQGRRHPRCGHLLSLHLRPPGELLIPRFNSHGFCFSAVLCCYSTRQPMNKVRSFSTSPRQAMNEGDSSVR